MKSISFRAKMISLLVLILIIFIILGVVMQSSLRTSNQIIGNLYQNSIKIEDQITVINNTLMTKVQVPIQKLRTTGKTDPNTIFGIRSAMKGLRVKLAEVLNLTNNSESKRIYLSAMTASLDKIFQSVEKILQFHFNGAQATRDELNQWNALYDSLNKHLEQFAVNSEKFSQEQVRDDKQTIQQIQKSLSHKSRLNITILIIGLLIIFIFPVLFIKDISQKYLLVIRYLTSLSKGNLNEDIPDISRDEMGWILHNVRKLRDSLRKITIEVNTAAGNLSIASHDLSASSQSIAQGASEQASSVEEVSSSIEQLASNIHQVSDNAKIAEGIANKLAETTDLMVAEARESQEKMTAIAEKVGIINEIAFQTNILALNAAVEAARAGEHGRGFGVVAVEVGKLAERSKKAAIEIENLIHSSVEVIAKAGEMMVEVAPEVNRTAEMVKSISQASIEQKMGADQINTAIQQLNEVTQQNAAASEEIATSAEELSAQADRLIEAQSFFKLDEKSQAATQNAASQSPIKPKKKLPQTVTTGKKSKSSSKGVDIDLGKPDDLDEEYERF
ncbi:methyl-accepting chemotaxis protein [Candidatus Sulfidibacterium hydrothermale]|uniref:methyl-accepting chemotaxis protein n=1 Tax=Candidatus Sulfidibacterium hydrothermale TaxID=2875962 RepID=UPI001F0A35E7|nr:methyl-accepting chemotaxis protein [Candidatus Sulfidibacterium hydrothermale]UBM61866.1 methyl-accepting chemotaxis protein [Candidatus Sulfidibacterium hydrothermale]